MDHRDGMITRRAALRRAAYALGGALSASTVAGVLAGCDAGGPSITFMALTARAADHAVKEINRRNL